MVVIVIRAQEKDSGEEICPSRTSFSVENPRRRVFASSRVPETYDERGCFNESWPSSHDLGSNPSPEPRGFEFADRSRTFRNGEAWGGPPDYREGSMPPTGILFSEKVAPHKVKKITYYRVPEAFETKRQRQLTSPDDFDNNVTVYRYCSSQVDPEDSIATTKEEEWVTKKKIELTTTRQIETRVKRQVVLEDGKVVEDSGPVVTTNTTEDTEKQEHNQTEHRTLGDDSAGENWVSVANPSGCVKEVQEKTVRSREETEERLETEDVQHLGSISDEGYMTAIKSGSEDFRQALETSHKKDIVESQPKIVHQSLKTKKFIDTEDKTELSQVQPGGKIINETRTTRLHEELGDCNVSDDYDSSNSASIYETTKKENSQKYRKTKEQDITEYLANGEKIGEKLHYQGETTEGERFGDHFNMDEMDNISSKLKKIRLRAQNRPALENGPAEILSKKSSTYDQEEETRKAETSKWLEHHFGSESTKSSKGSAEDLDDIIPSTQNSFISVTMKSQPLMKNTKNKYFSSSDEEKPFVTDRTFKNLSSDNESYIIPPNKNSYFQGISQWPGKKEEERFDSVNRSTEYRSTYGSRLTSSPKPQTARNYFNSTPISKIEGENRSSPLGEPARRFQPISPIKSNASISSKSKGKSFDHQEEYRNRSPASFYQTSDTERNRPSPPLRKKQKEISGFVEKEFEPRNRRQNHYSPFSDHESKSLRTPTPKEEDATTFSLPPNKKLYQRTRFAADIPPPQPRPPVVKQKSKIGESFRKFVGKLRSSSTDRKNKKKARNGSRSPSPKENTYQNYNSLDNYGSLVDKEDDDVEEPIAPPRGKSSGHLYRAPREGDRLVQRYYLGEDPFSTSIYGREKEYEENIDRRGGNRRPDDATDGEADFKSRTLGRFSKSTSRLINPEIQRDIYSYERNGVQTLPRKFRDERNQSKPVTMVGNSRQTSSYAPNRWKLNRHNSEERQPLHHTGSMINVSIVNQPYIPPSEGSAKRPGICLNGPAKPARTYRSNLSRSQSFNLQPGERSFPHGEPCKSNPYLHRLDETSAPLESPGIISSWNQNSKQLNGGSRSTETKDKRILFMKGLYDRAPELFKTLHGDTLDEMEGLKKTENRGVTYSNSFRSTSTGSTTGYGRYTPRDTYAKTRYPEDVIKTVSRSESSGNDDYSETVRINSKSDDPLNPSETNTIKIYSKKKIPLKNGHATETIESSETKTVVKSQGLRENERGIYNRSPSGVVIKVRNRN